MIHELKRLDQYVYAYISWLTVNDHDIIDSKGSHVIIDSVWIHPDYRRHGVLQYLIDYVFQHKTTQNADTLSWYREEQDRMSGILPKEWFKRYAKEN